MRDLVAIVYSFAAWLYGHQRAKPNTGTIRALIDCLVAEGIGTLEIGKNVGRKQEANMGKKNNQSFVFIPHARFIDMLTHKSELVGVGAVTIEERHTSNVTFSIWSRSAIMTATWASESNVGYS